MMMMAGLITALPLNTHGTDNDAESEADMATCKVAPNKLIVMTRHTAMTRHAIAMSMILTLLMMK